MRKTEEPLQKKKQSSANHSQHSMYFFDKCQEMVEMGSWEYSPAKDSMHWSKGLYQLLGYSRRTVRPNQKKLLAQVHVDDLPWVEQAYTRSFTHGENHDIIYRLNRDTGTIRYIRDRCEHQLSSEGQIVCSYGFLHDITELQETRMALQRSRDEMDRFAHIASHDLQEPLRAITGFLQLLEHRHMKQLDDKGKLFVERSIKAGRQMELLIKELLGLARVSTRGAAFKETDLGTIYDEVHHQLQFVIKDKKAHVACSELPVLNVDGAQIAILFYNLIKNGLQYSTSDQPQVTIDCCKDDKNYLFSIRDNGIGIDSQFHQRIFEVFQRLHTQQENPGTGMGLTMSKRIVERHGGRIWLESAQGSGSVFYFTLPAS